MAHRRVTCDGTDDGDDWVMMRKSQNPSTVPGCVHVLLFVDVECFILLKLKLT